MGGGVTEQRGRNFTDLRPYRVFKKQKSVKFYYKRRFRKSDNWDDIA